MMGIRHFSLVVVLLAAASAPAFAVRSTAPGRSGEDYYLRNPSAAASFPVDRDQDPMPVELTGTVASIDRDREVVRLRTPRGLQTVELYDGTRVRFESGRPASLSDLRVGDDLRVSGEAREGRMVAEQMRLLGPSSAAAAADLQESPRDPHGAVLVGTVRTPTYDVSRRIKVRTAEGDVTVTVDPGVSIHEAGVSLSVHDLDRGDRVRVVGDWESQDRVRARRIQVLAPAIREQTRGYRASASSRQMPITTVLGKLVSYDHNRDRMRLRTLDGDRIVIAKGTPAYVRGNPISRGDMRAGDRVRATGYWDGQELLATRVELAY